MSVVNEQVLSELRARNEARAQKIKEQMGEKFLLHPSHRVVRKDLRPSVLSSPPSIPSQRNELKCTYITIVP